jgi:mitotic spindle assembly checkpoint protein MAD1
MSSSPFIEHPSYDLTPSRSILQDESDVNLRQVISKLKFELSSTKTEKKLIQQEKEAMATKYETLLSKKNEEILSLKANFDYLFDEKKQLESKLENQQQISSSNSKLISQNVETLTSENNKLTRKVNELDSGFNRLVRKYEHVKSDFNYQLQANDQLNTEISHLKESLDKAHLSNEDLVEQLSFHSRELNNENSLNKLNLNLQNKNASLQKLVNQMQVKIDTLLQNKTSLELLKQKNLALSNKVNLLESIEEKYCQLEIENLELSNRFNDFFDTITKSVKLENESSQSNESKIINFIEKFNQLQYDILIFRSKYEESQAENNELRSVVLTFEENITTLKNNISHLQTTNGEKEELVTKLQRQKVLNVKEIEYLRNLIKELDERNLKNSLVDNKSTNQYLTNLEKLVDEYRSEINTLQKQVNNSHPPFLGDKRPRIVDDNLKSVDYKNQAHKFESENLKLLSHIKQLEGRITKLNENLKNNENLISKRQELRVLQLKVNPAAKDQLIKQQTLEVLQKENQDLINTYINNAPLDAAIPKSIFERQENDKAILQTKVDQLSKRLNRLKIIYGQKSKDLLSIISKYFGYTIEFLPSPINPSDLSSRIKLVSRYMNNKEESNTSYLIIDVTTKSLKAYGNHEFKDLYEDLLTSYDREQIPCFLSALNLKIYEKYVTKI